jgi:hypothetical protein
MPSLTPRFTNQNGLQPSRAARSNLLPGPELQSIPTWLRAATDGAFVPQSQEWVRWIRYTCARRRGKRQPAVTAKSQSERRRGSVESWDLEKVSSLANLVAAWCLSQYSHKQPLDEWGHGIAPSVYLAVFSAVANALTAYALASGLEVTFWRNCIEGHTVRIIKTIERTY